MTNKIKKFLYILVHLIPDGHDEIPTFALYHPLLPIGSQDRQQFLPFFPVAEIGSNIHLLYFSYPQEIWAQFVEWGKKVLSPYRPHWSVYFSVSLLQIAGKHPVVVTRHQALLLLFIDGSKWNKMAHCVWYSRPLFKIINTEGGLYLYLLPKVKSFSVSHDQAVQASSPSFIIERLKQ